MYQTKYIRSENNVFYLFSSETCLNHSDLISIKWTLCRTTLNQVSAGFAQYSEDDGTLCFYGESASLRLSSCEGDKVIDQLFDNAYQILLTRESGLVAFDSWIATNDKQLVDSIKNNNSVKPLNKKLLTESKVRSRFFK